MAYTIFHPGREEDEAWITFTSKTRVGLNEEIDRFIMEKMPETLGSISGHLVPSYSILAGDLETPWSVRMVAYGMIKD